MKIKTFVEIPIEVEVDYTPRRPAPMVQCHDDPGFSDPGDDESIEITSMYFAVPFGDNAVMYCPVPDQIQEFIKEKIEDDVSDQCRE